MSFLVLSVGSAQAEAPALISYGSFKSVTTYPYSAAVDQSTGDVYVGAWANESAPFLDKFEGAGKLISPPSPFGEEGLHAGSAVDPTNGDVDVLNAFGTIETYDPSTGKQVGTPFPVKASGNLFGFATLVQIATDAAGNVYVPVVPENEVLEYSPTGTLLNTFTGSGAGALKGPTGVAVDSSGDLWVADAGDKRLEKLSPSDQPLAEISSEGAQSVALDSGGDVLAMVENRADLCGSIEPPCAHLVEYNSAGSQIADVGAGVFDGGEGVHYSGVPHIVAADVATGRVYVPDMSRNSVWVFGPPLAPTVGKEIASEASTSEAKLGALVNPGGIPTTYRFEYGTTAAYGMSVPTPEGSVGEGLSSRTVWAAASSLAPGTTYHYRVVATNELGTVDGPDQTFTTLTAEQAVCLNGEFRGGFSARLPDCRAYELVTPPVKTSVEFDQQTYKYESSAAADGDAVTLRTAEPLPGAPTGGYQYVATQDIGGWSLEDIMPTESYTGVLCSAFASVEANSEELTSAVINVNQQSRASVPFFGNAESCNAEGHQVVSGEPVGYQNLLLRDNATGTYRLVNAPPPGVTPADADFQAASADLSHVVFTEKSPLTEGAQYGAENLYEWDEGTLRLLTVLPNGTPVTGSMAVEKGNARHDNVVSSDGSHIFFTASGGLYVRVDGEHTVQIDESQGGSDPSGGGSFQTANASGTEALFLDDRKLTPDSTAQAGEPDLYECTLPKGASKCQLSDLTVANAGEHADVTSITMLSNHDSSYVYFIAKGVLASNAREFTNSEGRAVVEKAESGRDNLYLWNGGRTTFIATFASSEGIFYFGGQMSPDGTWLGFESNKSLTGYDNVELNGILANELFLYDATTGHLVCASCDPSGEAPVSGVEENSFNGKRRLTNGGRLFFETREALVPSDTNGQPDVYEYENGQVYLISSGTSSFESNLEDASENGDDVFFRSTQQLVPQDTQEGMVAIYDARVGGGFPAPASPPSCTTANACRVPGSPQPSIYGAPSSQTFEGAGNLAPSEAKPKAKPKAKPVKCKKGFVKKKGKCVKKPAKKAKESARANRRGK